jgi:hypothetical protein
MRETARSVAALVSAVSLSATLVACLPKTPLAIGFGTTVLYNFLMIMLYGWPLYLPFVLLHGYLLKRYPARNRLTSGIIGGLLASAIVVLLTNSLTPVGMELGAIHDSQLLTILVYGSGGGLYGLLYRGRALAQAGGS